MFSVQRLTRFNLNGIRFARMYSPTTQVKADKDLSEGDAREKFAKIQAASEQEYFYRRQKEQLEELKSNRINERKYHQNAIEEIEKQLQIHKKHLKELTV